MSFYEAPQVKAFLWSEDGSSYAIDVLEAMVEHLLRRAFPQPGRPPEIQRIELQGIDRTKLTGSQWKAQSRLRVELIRSMATELAKDNFVFVHLDGDSPWASRNQRKSSNRSQWEQGINHALLGALPEKARHQINNLLIIEPFYSIESWLFQNTRTLREWYENHAPKHADIAHIQAFEQDRSLLDEIKQVKNHLSVGSRHNYPLATENFPTREVLEAKKSFAAAHDQLQACAALKKLLTPHETR